MMGGGRVITRHVIQFALVCGGVVHLRWRVLSAQVMMRQRGGCVRCHGESAGGRAGGGAG